MEGAQKSLSQGSWSLIKVGASELWSLTSRMTLSELLSKVQD